MAISYWQVLDYMFTNIISFGERILPDRPKTLTFVSLCLDTVARLQRDTGRLQRFREFPAAESAAGITADNTVKVYGP